MGILSVTTVVRDFYENLTLTASIVVVDGLSSVTLGYTLNMGSCSFFSGCRFANYRGSSFRRTSGAGRPAWQRITAPVARSVIAAGADVNEIVDIRPDENFSVVDAPLLAVARYGSPAVAAVLLSARRLRECDR